MGNAQFHAPNPLHLNIARALRLDFGVVNIAVEVVVEEVDFDIVAVVVGIARKNNKTTVCAAQQISFDFRMLDNYSFLSPHTIFVRFFYRRPLKWAKPMYGLRLILIHLYIPIYNIIINKIRHKNLLNLALIDQNKELCRPGKSPKIFLFPQSITPKRKSQPEAPKHEK